MRFEVARAAVDHDVPCPVCAHGEPISDAYCPLCGDQDGFATESVPSEIAAVYLLSGLKPARACLGTGFRWRPWRFTPFGIALTRPRRPRLRPPRIDPVADVVVSGVGGFTGVYGSGSLVDPRVGPGGDVQIEVGRGLDGPDGWASVDVANGGVIIKAGDAPILVVRRGRVWIRGLLPFVLAVAVLAAIVGALGGWMLSRL